MKSTEELLCRIKEQPADDLSFLDEPDYNCPPDPGAHQGKTAYKTGFQDWDERYQALCCLKESGDKKVYLLEERNGLKRLICKIASGEQAVFLKREYEILEKQSGMWKFDTLELREEESSCALLRDYVEGMTLAELVREEGVLDPDEAARLGIRICRVLEVLHREEPPVIHRDLKPENILVTAGGRIRLIDFEAARFHKPDQNTDTVNIGTRGYAPPEQFGYGQTDIRTDIYAVGKILLYMTTGKCEAESAPADRKGKAFGKIIRRCCAYDPSRRYADAQKLEKALRLFLERRPASFGRFWPAAAAALCLAGGWGGFLLGQRTMEQKLTQTENRQESEKTQGLKDLFVTWDPLVYRENIDEIIRLLGEGNYEEMAAACETFVKELRECEVLRSIEPVAFWELDEEELADYYASRQGYEFIADQLACKENLTERRLGTYKESADGIAGELRTFIEYTWTNEDGTTGSSALHEYVVIGDDRNIDGCIIEILRTLNEELDLTAETESEEQQTNGNF